jgi:chromatin segregation and condensation protein Rec8/ScpA/Scc1 (kleisin family)
VAYAVSTPVYEGPFDLLLHLIAKEQVNLFEVSISLIVDAFLIEIEAMNSSCESCSRNDLRSKWKKNLRFLRNAIFF